MRFIAKLLLALIATNLCEWIRPTRVWYAEIVVRQDVNGGLKFQGVSKPHKRPWSTLGQAAVVCLRGAVSG